MAKSGAERKLAALHKKWAEHFAQLYAPQERALVFGEGPIAPRIALVGEAPGKEEALQGRPFVGKAGKNLDEFLAAIALPRASLYITNTVKFRPVRLSEKGTASNRAPTAEENALFRPWLLQELALVAPRWIVTLGNTPLRALSGSREAIGSVHGRPRAAVPELAGATLFPLYHPASVIYNPALLPVYAQDLQSLKELLEANER